ncbi:hypothetical protein FRC11_013508 [Ceratobasidium sp. 423]|nr:hypothetical protein FRC11_013508 [Ceratobasidium sp. 423]
MNRGTKAEQWRNLLLILLVALFEAWRIDDAIPNADIPCGGERTKHFKAQDSNATRLHWRRTMVHAMEEGDLDEPPQLEDCAPSRSPRDFYGNILRYRITYVGISQHRLTQNEINESADLFEQVGAVKTMQSLEDPTDDDIKTTQVLFDAMQDGPKHEIQRGMLDAVLAGEAWFHRQGI